MESDAHEMLGRRCFGIAAPPNEGEPGAMAAIADMLEEGRCVDQDLVGAVLWYGAPRI